MSRSPCAPCRTSPPGLHRLERAAQNLRLPELDIGIPNPPLDIERKPVRLRDAGKLPECLLVGVLGVAFLGEYELVVVVEDVPVPGLYLTALQKPVNKNLIKPSVDVELVGLPVARVHESVLRDLVGQHSQHSVRTTQLIFLRPFGKLGGKTLRILYP